MKITKPNHICKNVKCTKGADGGRKHYYACNYCDRTNRWKSVACSIECYEAYCQQVIDARSKGDTIDNLPIRTDITPEETQEIMSADIDEVMEQSKKELEDYINPDDDDTVHSISDAIDAVNQELNEASEKKQKKSKKSSYNYNKDE